MLMHVADHGAILIHRGDICNNQVGREVCVDALGKTTHSCKNGQMRRPEGLVGVSVWGQGGDDYFSASNLGHYVSKKALRL